MTHPFAQMSIVPRVLRPAVVALLLATIAASSTITGGHVYRGKAYPDLVGAYLFGDYCSGEIWFVDRAAARGVAPRRALDTRASITSFGEDEAGKLHVTDGAGTLYRITDS